MQSAETLSRNIVFRIILAAGLQGTLSGYALTFFPLAMEMARLSNRLIGLGNSIQMGAIIAVTLILPFFLQKISLPYLYIGSCLIAVITALALTTGFHFILWYLFLRFVLGCCLSIVYVVFEYWLNSGIESRHRGKILACYGMAVVGGMGGGPLLIPYIGMQGFMPYGIFMLLFAVCGLIAFSIRHNAPAISRDESAGNLPVIFRQAPILFMAGLFYGIAESSLFAFLSIYGMDKGLSDKQAVSLVSCIFWGGIAIQFFLGMLADRFGSVKILAMVTAVNAIGAFILPVLIGSPSEGFWVYMFLWGGTIPPVYILIATCIGHAYKGAGLANATLAFILMYGIGSMLGPNITSMTIDMLTPHGLPIVVGIVSTASCLFTGWSLSRRKNV